jgi:type II secretory pathway component PulF
MPVFEYRAKLQSGKKTKGTVVAESPRQARDQLRGNGWTIESLQPVEVVSDRLRHPQSANGQSADGFSIRLLFWNWLAQIRGRAMAKQVTWFTRELATLLHVGTPMVDALALSLGQTKGRFRTHLLDIRDRITSGVSLGEAIRQHPHVFDNVLCEMVTVGEQSGALQSVLQQAADFREERDKLKDRVFSALLYPSLVFLLSVFVTIFLMTFVVPTLLASLLEMQRELPWPTRVLKWLSDTLIGYGPVLLTFFAFLFVAVGFSMRTKRGKRFFDAALLKVPLMGTLVVKQDCARLCMVTATLVKSGVELVRALEIAERAVRNSIIAEVVADARTKVSAGTELGSALNTRSVLPPALIQVFSLGQNTGQLEDLLFQIAKDYNHQVNMLADRLTTIMEPLLIVGLSLIVGFILMATLLPILETGNALSDS